VTSVGPGTAQAPDATSPVNPPETSKRPDRRTIQLPVSVEAGAAPEPPPAVVVVPEPRRSPLPTSRDDWLRLAEHLVGDWTATLRDALVLALLFAAMITSIGIAFGPTSAAAATTVGLVVFLAGRRQGTSE
jgi:hypothetical protein